MRNKAGQIEFIRLEIDGNRSSNAQTAATQRNLVAWTNVC